MISAIQSVSIHHAAAIEEVWATRRAPPAADCRKSFPLSSTSLHDLITKIHQCGCSARARLNFIQALLAMGVSKLYLGLGYSTIALYAEKNFGCDPFLTYDYLKIARALSFLPLSSQAYIDGTIAWPELRLLAYGANGENEKYWVEFAATHSLSDLEDEIREAFDRERLPYAPGPASAFGAPFLEDLPSLYA